MGKESNKGLRFLTSRYLVALLAPLLITGVMQVSWPFFEPNPISVYLPAVMFCAWYGGPGPGLLCVAISFLLSDLFFIEPFSLFQFHRQSDLVRGMTFLVVGPTICLLSELMHRERRRSVVNLNALRASEERYRKLADNFPNGAVITYDKNLRVTFIAGRGLQQSGFSAEHFLGKSLSEITPPEVAALVEPHFQTAFGGQLVTYECPFPNGKTYFAAVAPLENGNGLINEILVISQDITEQKQVDQDLRASETKYRRLLDSSIVGVIFWSLKGEILYANDLFLSMTGYTREDLSLGRLSWKNITPPEYAHVDEQAISQLMATGTCSPFEKEYLRKDGGRVSVLIGSALLEGETGTGSSFIMDITERKQAEETLAKAAAIVESSDDAIIGKTLDGTITSWNKGAARVYGYEAEEVIGRPISILIPPEHGDELPQILERVRRGKRVDHYETLRLRKDNTRILVSLSVSPVNDGAGRIVGAAAIARDITERKCSQESLNLFRNLIDQSSDAIEVLEPDTLRFLDCNTTAHQTLGYTREDFLSLTAFDIDPLIDQSTTARLKEELDKSPFVIYESVHRRKDSSTFPVEINAKTIHLESDYYLAVVRDITDRKRAEAALRDAERKYRDIFENAGEGIFQSTPDGRYLAANPRLAQIYGFASPEELIQSNPDIARQIYVDPARREEFKRQLDEKGWLRGVEYQVFRKDGSKIWISVNARAVRNEKGATQYYEGTAQDITDRKRAEEALRESEERYRDLVENSLDLICTHDLDGWLLSANRAAIELMGYSASAGTGGINFRQILAPEVRDQFDDYLKQIRRDRAASGLMLVQTTSGEKRIWEYHSTLRTEGIAEPIVRGVARDVTERKRAAEALRESEERYRDLFENAKDAIYAQDLTGVYVSVNWAAELLSGYDRSEIVGKHFEQFVAPEYLPVACENISKKLDDKEQTSYEIEVIAKDGHRVPVELSSALILKHGVPVGIQGIARDITERKRAEQALRSYSRQLIEAQEAERQHIARELHDQIGQVLTAIRINLQTVGNSCDTDDSRSLVDQSVGLVDAAIEQVRNLSFELRPSLLDNLGLAAALRWYCDQYTQRTGIRTRSVSNLSEHQTRLRQELETACFRIVQEALTNVVRHARAKNVFIDLTQVDHQIVLSIKDDGIGFIGKTNGGAATSLGLRGMKERALALGGTLKIDSGPAQGTEIQASFPTESKEN